MNTAQWNSRFVRGMRERKHIIVKDGKEQPPWKMENELHFSLCYKWFHEIHVL